MAQAELEKTFDVDASKYFQAVSQYEKYPEFVDGMKQVKIEKREGDAGGIQKYQIRYDLSMLSKEMNYVLQLQDEASTGSNPATVNWTLLKSDFFKVNNGAWKIESLGPGKCKVFYSLDVEFNFSVPGFILKGLVKSTLPSMMNSFYERAKKL